MSIDFSSSTYPLVEANKVARSSSGDSTLIKGRLSGVQGDGFFPAFSASGQDVWHDKYKHEGTAIILSAVGARCGKCFFAKGRWSAIANTHVIWPKENLIDPDYLHHILNNESFWIRGGSAQPFVKVRDSLKQRIPVPPLEEQRRIVARIKECMERVEEIERLRLEANAEAIALSLATFADFVYDLSKSEAPIVALGDVVTSCKYGSSKKSDYESDGFPILRMGNIKEGKLDVSDLKRVKLNSSEAKKYLLQDGDILVNRTNSLELVGKSGLFRGLRGDWVYASYLVRLRIDENKAIPSYINGIINSRIGREYVLKTARRAIGQVNINAKEIQAMPIPLPSLEIQAALVEKNELTAPITGSIREEYASSEVSHLRDAILRKAFSGEL